MKELVPRHSGLSVDDIEVHAPLRTVAVVEDFSGVFAYATITEATFVRVQLSKLHFSLTFLASGRFFRTCSRKAGPPSTRVLGGY
jgi:hypothetical protein